MPQPGCSTQGQEPPCSRWHRCRRDWRSLLPELAQLVPWPCDRAGGRTQLQVLQHVLWYIQHLQRTLSIVQGEAGPSGDGDTVEEEPSAGDTEEQRLVPYEEEEDMKHGGPWLCPTGPEWEALDGEGVSPLSPPSQPEFSPSLLASPLPLASPSEVLQDLFPSICLSPEVGAVTPPLSPQAPAVTPRRATRKRGTRLGPGEWGGSPRPKKCVNGFIMFCRLNRKPYLRAHPGLSSTAATRELAQLWHSLSPTERHPYRLRAQRFSRLHNRVIRRDREEEEEEEEEENASPPPLQVLLATHAGQLKAGSLPP